MKQLKDYVELAEERLENKGEGALCTPTRGLLLGMIDMLCDLSAKIEALEGKLNPPTE